MNNINTDIGLFISNIFTSINEININLIDNILIKLYHIYFDVKFTIDDNENSYIYHICPYNSGSEQKYIIRTYPSVLCSVHKSNIYKHIFLIFKQTKTS